MAETNLNKGNNNQSNEIQVYSNESALSSTATRNNFAQFEKNSASKSAVVMMSDPCIDGRISKVSTSDADNGSLASSNSSDTILDHLNDDCMIAIFEYLPLRDLCNVADVCSVFESNAVSVFQRKFSDFNLDELMDESDIDYSIAWDASVHHFRFSMESAERLFRHFGAYIQTIRLENDDLVESEKDQITEWMINYCAHKNAKLEKLVLHGITSDLRLMPRFQSLFDRLKYLDVTGGSFYCGSDLTDLILDEVELDGSFIRTLEKLQTLSLTDVRESYFGLFDSFLTLNPQLKSLTLADSAGFSEIRMQKNKWIKTNFSVIGSLSELEELRLHSEMNALHGDKDINKLSRLQHLKVFSCICFELPMTELLINFAKRDVLPIEELDLRNFTLDSNMAPNLAKFSKMKKLSFSDGYAQSGQLLNAIKGMPHLEKLSLSNFKPVSMNDIKATIENALKLNELRIDFPWQDKKFILNMNDFNEIRQLIEGRENLIKLNLNVSGNRCKLDVPKSILERNSWCLEVEFNSVYR